LCGQEYQSNNELDLDGDGDCTPCKDKKLEVARKVDAEMALVRSARDSDREGESFFKKKEAKIYYESGN
jgi:hypothetical protein